MHLLAGIRLQVTHKFPGRSPYLKIVITSGYPSDDWDRLDAAELEELPSDSVEVLQKPFSLTTLLDTIHRLIGWPQVMAPVQKMKAAL
jgi:hypothetical protein